MVSWFIPDSGVLIYVDVDPTKGSEQTGPPFVIVIRWGCVFALLAQRKRLSDGS